MAQPNGESRDTTNNCASSDFSVISGNGDGALGNGLWPRPDGISFTNTELPRSAQADETFERYQLSASHFALVTAYERVTKKLADAEQRNQQLSAKMQGGSLQSQDSFRSGRLSGVAGSQTNLAMHADVNESVNEAWEAYNEKCNECRQLREELEDVRQKLNNTEHLSRIQNLQENVLREKAKQDDVVRRLEKTKMEAGHLEKKEILAREELEKEREYQKSIIDSAERRHRELEQKIEELENKLALEKQITEDLRRKQKGYQNELLEEFNSKTGVFNSKIRDLEERNIALKEEVAVLVSMQASLANGLGSVSLGVNGPSDFDQASTPFANFEDDKEAAALGADIQLLRNEVEEMRTRATEQANILEALCQNPKFHQLVHSVNVVNLTRIEDSGLPPSILRSGLGSISAHNSTELSHKRKNTNSPESRACVNNLHNDVSSPSWPSSSIPPQDAYGSSTMNAEVPPGKRERSNSRKTPVLKTPEEFIQDLDPEGARRSPGNSEAPPNLAMFPPMDVSRTIHKPEAGGPAPAVHTTVADFTATVLGSQPPVLAGNTSTLTSQSIPYAGENTRHLTNGQLHSSQNMQNSLTAMDADQHTQYYSTVSSYSHSSSETVIPSAAFSQYSARQPPSLSRKNSARDVDVPTAGKVITIEAPSEMLRNPSGNHKRPAQTRKSLSDLDNEVPHSSRQSQLAANFDVPGSRHLSSVEDGGDSSSLDEFEVLPARSKRQQRRPKEYAVPRVVRASALPAESAQARKAFQDSGYRAPSTQIQARPATRAKTDQVSSSTQDVESRSNRHENGPANGRRRHPHNDKAAKEDVAAVCPVCDLVYQVDWTEEIKRVHVNGHFSDEDDGVLALD